MWWIVLSVVSGAMEQQLWKESLLLHRERIIESADIHDVLLNRLLDRLLAARCIQLDQKEIIKRKETARERCGTLLDFIHAEGKRAFNELCEALEKFGTEDKQDLVDSMRAFSLQKDNQEEAKSEIGSQ